MGEKEGRKVEKRKAEGIIPSSYLSTAPGSRWRVYMYLILPYSRWIGFGWEYIHIKQVRLVCRQVQAHAELDWIGSSLLFSSVIKASKQANSPLVGIYLMTVICFTRYSLLTSLSKGQAAYGYVYGCFFMDDSTFERALF